MEKREKCWKEMVTDAGARVFRHNCGDDIEYYEQNLVDIVNEPFIKLVELLDLIDNGREENLPMDVDLLRDLCNRYQDELENLLFFVMDEFGNIKISIARNGDVMAGRPLGVSFETAEFLKKRRAELTAR